MTNAFICDEINVSLDEHLRETSLEALGTLGRPLGASGARLVTSAPYQLERVNGRFALCTLCVGVGQGITLAIERV